MAMAADIIDWNIPSQSIFDRKIPLVENTMKRIAKGIQKFIIDNPEPILVKSFLTQYHSYSGDDVRGQGLDKPIMTIDTSNRYGLVTAFISQQFKTSIGHKVEQPLWTTTTVSKTLTLKGLAKDYNREDEARQLLENLRWAGGVCCPRCGSLDVAKVEANHEKEIRKGLYRCKDCRNQNDRNKRKDKDAKAIPSQFTVTVGTIFEDSHIDLHIWLQAITLLCSSKKGISAHQLHRQLGITYKSAWFMAHRIRYAMGTSIFTKMKGTVEADETYVGGKSRRAFNQTGFENKTPVVSLVQRNGKVRSFVVSNVTGATLREVLTKNIHPTANLMTDELSAYKTIGNNFVSHDVVNHSKYEYVRGNAYTNTVEGFFSILKRGINGVYHHVSKEHLHRYLAEFDFRYNNRKIDDNERTLKALAGFEGKRLKYGDS